jgi:hypothetical protein
MTLQIHAFLICRLATANIHFFQPQIILDFVPESNQVYTKLAFHRAVIG